MRDIQQILGKRVVVSESQPMYERYPGSDSIRVLPVGQPSPRIESYLPSGYFQLEGSEGVEQYYLKDGDRVSIVDDNTPDDSTLFERVNSAFTNLIYNNSKKIQNQAGYLSDGVRETFDEAFTVSIDLGKYLQQTLIIIAGILLLWIISKIIP